jgi:putative CocE/NonD family hydrolase
VPVVIAALLASAAVQAQPLVSALPKVPELPAVEVQFDLAIPLRDKVRLRATRYRAAGATGAVPCVFTLTPYIRQSYHDRGMYFAQNGYVFLTVDARGRGDSEGEFRPMIQEAQDGHDIVEWLAKQDFCNGKVAMWGGSYAGYNQWMTATRFPRGLATIVPVASPFAGVDFPMQGMIPYSYDIQWLTLVSGNASQSMMFGDQAYWASVYKRWYLSGRPFRELDQVVGNPSKTFQEWMDHPSMDAYWDSYNPGGSEYRKLDLPILTITGHYDGDQPGALTHYRQYMANASREGRERHWLVIGPWDHPGTRTPLAEFGGVRFGEASVQDLNALHKAWYDWTMKSGTFPTFLKAPVVYYVTGKEQWRYAESLDGVTAGHRPLYVHSVSDRANDVFLSGGLRPDPEGDGGTDRYVYDPKDTSPANLIGDTAAPGLTNQAPLLLGNGADLIYHSAPFAEDTDLAGFFRFRVLLELDQPDTDFAVNVFDVRPDGTSLFLAAQQLRARYRESAREPKPVTPGAVTEFRFDDFTFVARTIARGNRLRLVFGPVATPYSQRNNNTGGVVADESWDLARPVTVKLHHGPDHPSVLEIPLAAASTR